MTHRRIAAAAAVAYLAASVAYAVPSVQVEVKYPDTVAAVALERRLAVEVSSVSQLAFQASSPSISVQATVAGYTADYLVDAAYSRAVARADVEYPRPRHLAAAVELEQAAEGWIEASVLPHVALLSAEAVQAEAEISYLIPTVALIETTLILPIEFFDAVVVTDIFENFRDLSAADGTSLVDTVAVAFGQVVSDSAPALDDRVTFLDRTLPDDSVTVTDLLGFGFFLNIQPHDWTSPFNGAAFNEYPLHDSNQGNIVAVTDHTLLLDHNKALADAVTPDDALQPFVVTKVLADTVSIGDGFSITGLQSVFFETLTISDDVAFNFLWTLNLGSGPTSPINGAAFNEWSFNAPDVGDWLYITDHQPLLHPVKALVDAVTTADELQPFFIGKGLADAPVVLEASAVDLTRPLFDTAAATDEFLIGRVFFISLHDAFTSTFNGHGLLLNDRPFNESNWGDGLMPVDVMVPHVTKALAHSVVLSEDLTPFFVGKVLTDATAPTETIAKAMGKPLTDSMTSSEALNAIDVGKALTESQSVAESHVKNIVPAGLTNSATTSDLVEIEHIVPVLVLLNQAPFNEVPFN